MKQVTWLILQRMHPPLLVLISTYSISIIRMVLVPDMDQSGQITHMDFFPRDLFRQLLFDNHRDW